jgi:hypothetical protein
LAWFGLIVGIIGAVLVLGWFPNRDEGPAFLVILAICVTMVATAAIDLVAISRASAPRANG